VETRPLLHPMGGASLVEEAGILSRGGVI